MRFVGITRSNLEAGQDARQATAKSNVFRHGLQRTLPDGVPKLSLRV